MTATDPRLALILNQHSCLKDTTLVHFRQSVAVENKLQGTGDVRELGPFDPVTAADKATEAALRAAITKAFPDDAILGEEYGTRAGTSGFTWVIDPIDGTRAFISGLPVWGVLIGVLHNGIPHVGAMFQPFTGEVFFGDGKSAFYEGPGGARALTTRATESLAEATLMTTSPRIFSPDAATAYDRLEARVRLARYGCDCYAYAMLAMGTIDLVAESGLKPYDILPLLAVLKGAGAIVTQWDGSPLPDHGEMSVLAAATPALHQAALSALSGTRG